MAAPPTGSTRQGGRSASERAAGTGEPAPSGRRPGLGACGQRRRKPLASAAGRAPDPRAPGPDRAGHLRHPHVRGAPGAALAARRFAPVRADRHPGRRGPVPGALAAVARPRRRERALAQFAACRQSAGRAAGAAGRPHLRAQRPGLGPSAGRRRSGARPVRPDLRPGSANRRLDPDPWRQARGAARPEASGRAPAGG